MQKGTLINFEPLIIDGQHSKWESLFKFKVTIESNGNTINGESLAKYPEGSKVWIKGKEHEFETKANQYAQGGINVSKLKCLETRQTASHDKSSLPYDIEKESYVISRFSHTFALEYLVAMPDSQRKQLEEEYGKEVISKLAISVAKSVDNVAKEIRKLHETQHPQAS